MTDFHITTIPEILATFKITKTRLAMELGIGRTTLFSYINDLEGLHHCVLNGRFMSTYKHHSVLDFNRLESFMRTPTPSDYDQDTVQKKHVCQFISCGKIFYGNQSRKLCRECWNGPNRYKYFE